MFDYVRCQVSNKNPKLCIVVKCACGAVHTLVMSQSDIETIKVSLYNSSNGNYQVAIWCCDCDTVGEVTVPARDLHVGFLRMLFYTSQLN